MITIPWSETYTSGVPDAKGKSLTLASRMRSSKPFSPYFLGVMRVDFNSIAGSNIDQNRLWEMKRARLNRTLKVRRNMNMKTRKMTVVIRRVKKDRETIIRGARTKINSINMSRRNSDKI